MNSRPVKFGFFNISLILGKSMETISMLREREREREKERERERAKELKMDNSGENFFDVSFNSVVSFQNYLLNLLNSCQSVHFTA